LFDEKEQQMNLRFVCVSGISIKDKSRKRKEEEEEGEEEEKISFSNVFVIWTSRFKVRIFIVV